MNIIPYNIHKKKEPNNSKSPPQIFYELVYIQRFSLLEILHINMLQFKILTTEHTLMTDNVTKLLVGKVDTDIENIPNKT